MIPIPYSKITLVSAKDLKKYFPKGYKMKDAFDVQVYA